MTTPARRYYLFIGILALVLGVLIVKTFFPAVWAPVRRAVKNGNTVESVVAELGPARRPEWEKTFQDKGCLYPPGQLTLIGLKQEKLLEVWCLNRSSRWQIIKKYPILAASGMAGPKMKEGDHQVPEGMYQIEGLNPNSKFHLSIKLNYPNDFDRRMADQDGRSNLGGDIFIHGNMASIGCLAMGDRAIEELFLLVADAGPSHVQVILAPHDLRKDISILPEFPPWVSQLYADIGRRMVLYVK